MDQNTKGGTSAFRLRSAKGNGGHSLKVLSNTTKEPKSRPQTSYGANLGTQKPYFVRF